MGKGDIKTRRGKIAKGTFGVTRPRAKSNNNVAAQSKPKAEKKPAVKKAPAKKKASSKK